MRLQSIDSLRGIAAFGVAVYHLVGFTFFASPSVILLLPGYGYTGVYLFFVISGFCIHLRYAHGREVNWAAFWKRRFVRLYPAYLASLILYVLWSRPEINGFFWYDLFSHLFMFHNLDGRTVYSINGVWWTLAIEEQLYALYFVLLWMRHNWGWTWTLAICLGARFFWLGMSLALHGHHELPFGEGALANWWTWALGALAVEAYVGKVKLPNWCYSVAPGLAFLLTAGILDLNKGRISVVFSSLLWGAGFFFLLNSAVRSNFSWRPLSAIGVFSYSLYLTHEFVISITPAWLAIPLCLAFAYVFFRLFERPFMRSAALKTLSPTAVEPVQTSNPDVEGMQPLGSKVFLEKE